MNTDIYFWSYLAHFFVEWELFQTKVVEKIKTHILWSVTPPPPRKSCRLWDNVEKYCSSGGPQITLWRMHIACWIPEATNTYTGFFSCSLLFHCNNDCTNAPQSYVIGHWLSCNIISPSTPRSSKWSLYFMLPHQNPVGISPLSHLPLIPTVSPFFSRSS